MGQSFSDPKVQEDIKRFTYRVKEGMSGHPKIVINNKMMHPEEIGELLLTKVRKLAENRLLRKIHEVVITVPAYFGSSQREATKNAAYLAGFETVHIINEPTAAALAFQQEENTGTKKILIYDFGGGTFDVSIASVKRNCCNILSTDGDCHLGGMHIDNALVNYVMEDCNGKGIHLDEDNTRLVKRIKMACENAKKKLSTLFSTHINLGCISTKSSDYELKLMRHVFDKIIEPIVENTIKIIEKCMSKARVTKDDIDIVLLVGGSTRILLIRERLKEYFGNEKINISKNPDLQVAKGAIVYASTLQSDKKEINFTDVLSLSLGTDVVGGGFSRIIERNTEIPFQGSKVYQTTYDDQDKMKIKIFEGEREIAFENRLLDEFCINIRTRKPAGKVLVKIIFSISPEGILTVSAQELETNNKTELKIDVSRQKQMSKADIEEKIKEAKIRRDSDTKCVYYGEKVSECEYLCNLIENSETYKENDQMLKKVDNIRRKVRDLNLDEVDQITKFVSELKTYIQ